MYDVREGLYDFTSCTLNTLSGGKTDVRTLCVARALSNVKWEPFENMHRSNLPSALSFCNVFSTSGKLLIRHHIVEISHVKCFIMFHYILYRLLIDLLPTFNKGMYKRFLRDRFKRFIGFLASSTPGIL